MTQEEIIKLAQQAGFHAWYSDPEREYHFGCAMKFAALVTAAEREACLEMADHCADADMHASMAANAIRARSNT